MNTFKYDEMFFQQLRRKTKMLITQKNIDAINRVSIPGFDDEEIETIKTLPKKLLKKSMNKNKSNEVGMLVNLQDWSDIMITGTENGSVQEFLRTCSSIGLKFLYGGEG